MKKLSYFLAIFTLILTSGCASMAHKKELSEFNQYYSSGQYIEAANVQLAEKGEEKSDPSTLLQTLQAAAALRYAGQYQQSSTLFDESEAIIKLHNNQAMAGDVGGSIAAVLVNDSVLDYRGREYDGVMVNTYKALNFWQEGQNDLARIEFNRALDRQRRAKERFADEIAQLKAELDQKQADNSTLEINKNVNNPEIESLLQEKYSNLYQFKAYPDFVNPFTNYLAGLFFRSEKDYPKATNLLKEARGMVENSTVADDFVNIERAIDGQLSQANHTWIIFENGLGPIKEEFRIDLPLFLLTNQVKYTGIALPKLALRDRAYVHLTINNGENQTEKTRILASMDRVIQTEFKQRYPAIVARAVTSTLIKTAAQYAAKQLAGQAGYLYGELAGLGMAIYQYASTAADTRIWTALPKEFQIAKVKTPRNGIITLATPAGSIINISVPKDNDSLVYVKIPSNKAEIVYDIIKM